MASFVALVAPSIDPLSEKNREMGQEEIDDVLRQLAIPTDRPIVTWCLLLLTHARSPNGGDDRRSGMTLPRRATARARAAAGIRHLAFPVGRPLGTEAAPGIWRGTDGMTVILGLQLTD